MMQLFLTMPLPKNVDIIRQWVKIEDVRLWIAGFGTHFEFLGFSSHAQKECSYSVKNWGDSLQDATVIDYSDSDDSVCE